MMRTDGPAELYGDLLAEVQMRRLFPDGKTFVDAVPRTPATEIMRAFAEVPRETIPLRDFVHRHFELPAPARVHAAHGERDLRRYILTLWPELIRTAAADGGSLLALPGPYVVPGGRFTELYYWDSYFTMLGLVRDGHEPLARTMADHFTLLIERYGHIPNGTRSYYLGRSQPPLYFAMLSLLPETREEVNARRLAALLTEHRFWMAGTGTLAPGERTARVVMMPDGAYLNRYWDARDTPRDESFYEDVATAAVSRRPAVMVYRDLRAGAESGWDFSSRWFDMADGLPGIRTCDIVPVDLNAFLYGLERMIADMAVSLGERATAEVFAAHASARRAALDRWCWSGDGHFADHDLRDQRLRGLTAATLAPLFAGCASDAQAAAVAANVGDRLLAPGGLRTTLVQSGEQWDHPNGWAPLQWIGFAGLRRYGYSHLADEIGRRWLGTVDAEFRRSGWIHEKYDIETGRSGDGGEYAPQLGFGWTNGVTAALIDLLQVTVSQPNEDHGMPLSKSTIADGTACVRGSR